MINYVCHRYIEIPMYVLSLVSNLNDIIATTVSRYRTNLHNTRDTYIEASYVKYSNTFASQCVLT